MKIVVPVGRGLVGSQLNMMQMLMYDKITFLEDRINIKTQ
jgi:hypothetical protein